MCSFFFRDSSCCRWTFNNCWWTPRPTLQKSEETAMSTPWDFKPFHREMHQTVSNIPQSQWKLGSSLKANLLRESQASGGLHVVTALENICCEDNLTFLPSSAFLCICMIRTFANNLKYKAYIYSSADYFEFAHEIIQLVIFHMLNKELSIYYSSLM